MLTRDVEHEDRANGDIWNAQTPQTILNRYRKK